MDKNFKLTIEYDGTRYHGWQRQPNGTTIQQEIETAVETMTRTPIRLIGSGRTDAGVHALGQVANFSCATRMGPEEMMAGLNSILPADIVIRACCRVPDTFHARYDAKGKIYRYHIANHPIRPAVNRSYRWWIRKPLDVERMQHAASLILGEHDFRSFEGAGSPRSHTIRRVTLSRLKAETTGDIRFTIEADGFLRYMVRNIVGSLVSVGLNKISTAGFHDILTAKDRTLAAATAPPQGLFLVQVHYPAEVLEEQAT
jgi:tRNA pseudouridine38-40 synthase